MHCIKQCTITQKINQSLQSNDSHPFHIDIISIKDPDISQCLGSPQCLFSRVSCCVPGVRKGVGELRVSRLSLVISFASWLFLSRQNLVVWKTYGFDEVASQRKYKM